MKRAAACLLALALSSATGARAQSVWRFAAEPHELAEQRVLEQLDVLIHEFEHLRDNPASMGRALVLNRARRLIERQSVGASADPALRLRVADVYYRLFDVDHETSLLEQAIPHFEFVAASSAPASTRSDALGSVAICYARLGDHPKEVAAYDRALAIEPDPERRAMLLANQAEGYMAMGRILRSIRGYRASLEQLPAVMMLDNGVSTNWGLAVALDRSGDIQGALETIGVARSYDRYDRSIKPGGSWFYVPSYDQYWYEALGHWQVARAVNEHDASLAAYESSVRAWREFLDAADRNDPWLSLAEIRLRQCEREREKTRARPHKPKARPDREGDEPPSD